MQPTVRDIVILSHLGMGDHIIVNGAIRKIYAESDFNTMYIIVKEEWLSNVKHMYRDLPKMAYIAVPNPSTIYSAEVLNFMNNFPGKSYNCWWYGHDNKVFFDEHQYTSLGFTYRDKYDWFKVERDLEREEEVYNRVVGVEKDYIFIADDPKRNYTIDPFRISTLPADTRIIRSADLLEYTLFDLLGIVEKSLEFHCMNSAFFGLIDCMSLKKIYLHNSYFLKVGPLEGYGDTMMNWLKDRDITHV